MRAWEETGSPVVISSPTPKVESSARGTQQAKGNNGGDMSHSN